MFGIIRFSLWASGLSAFLFANGGAAACSGPLAIDNFAQYSSNTNSLNSWAGDDGSMTSISAAGNKLAFKPKNGSYFYETFSCQAASTAGYNSLQFTLKGLAGGSLTLEIQTQTSCSATSYTSKYFYVSDLTGATQTITVPFGSFAGANANAVTAIVWGDFSNTSITWEMSQVQFGCGAAGSSSAIPSSSAPATSSSRSASSSVPASSSLRPASSSVPAASSSNPASSSMSSFKPANSTQASSTSSIKLNVISSTMATSASPSASGQCSNLLIDDWSSQSRLTFLYYNSMLQPSSDDATMKTIVVGQPATNRVTLTPANTNSYFYSQVGCLNANNIYGGISLRIKAPVGTTFTVELSSASTCGGDNTANIDQTTSQLGWKFDNTEKLYTIPFSKFAGLDTSKISTVYFGNFNKAVSFGPMAFYCGNTATEYIVTTTSASAGPSSTVAAPSGTASALVIDRFANKDSNALGFWHGGDDGMTLTWAANKLTIKSTDADYSFYTQLSATCADMTNYDGSYLHIAYSGSNAFTVALQQHNSDCNENIAPYPETWDSLEASRYASASDIYIPMSHFNVVRQRIIGLALKGFYKTDAVVLTKIEIVKSVPASFKIPSKLPSGNLIFACKRPNSFAFAIDDGSPEYAQQVLQTIREENIKVTFFTVGAPLLDPSTNLSNVYNEMLAQGHQIALHSYTHPKMESLPDYGAIDWEYNQDIAAVAKVMNGMHTPYFRPPFGNEGARMRQRLAVATGTDSPYIVNWSVDVEDWLWATSSTPEKQLDAFKRDIGIGGNLVVMHYLYPSTVGYLKQFIQLAKATGKQLMRVDQCMMDPNAPPL